MEIVLNEDNFEKEVLHASKPVLVEFYSDRQKSYAKDKLAAKIIGECTNLKVCLCDAQKNIDLVSEYRVMSYPTLMLFKDGRPSATFTGSIEAEEVCSKLAI